MQYINTKYVSDEISLSAHDTSLSSSAREGRQHARQRPGRILLKLAGQHQLADLLPLALRRFAAGPNVAPVRIWRIRPPLADDCSQCRFATDGRLQFDLPDYLSQHREESTTASPRSQFLTDAEVRQFEVHNIRTAPESCHGKIYSDDGATRLGMKPTTLASRIKALQIRIV